MGKTITDLNAVTTVGLDLAKHVFQVHAVDSKGRLVTMRALRRKDVLAFFESLPCCLIGLEACGSAHHWGRELMSSTMRASDAAALREGLCAPEE